MTKEATDSTVNRDQKAAAIDEIAGDIDESEAIFAVDYRGITVAQVAELRTKLRDADATFHVVKNSLTERAADQADAPVLKDFLAGPTALTFVRGDAAVAAKAIADYARATQLLPFKGGVMDGAALDADQIRALSRLPSREVLYGQLVGVVASPVTGLVRTLNALIGGLAVALGQVREKKESGRDPRRPRLRPPPRRPPGGARRRRLRAPAEEAAAPRRLRRRRPGSPRRGGAGAEDGCRRPAEEAAAADAPTASRLRRARPAAEAEPGTGGGGSRGAEEPAAELAPPSRAGAARRRSRARELSLRLRSTRSRRLRTRRRRTPRRPPQGGLEQTWLPAHRSGSTS